MLFFNKVLLLAVPTVLLQAFTSTVVEAVPVPAPAPTNHVISHSHTPPPANQQHAAQVRLPNSHAMPTITGTHSHNQHAQGTLPLHPASQLDAHGRLPHNQLEAHGHHIAEALDSHPVLGHTPNGWQVHAHHDPHANHVRFEAVQKPIGTPSVHHTHVAPLHQHQSGHAARNPQEHQNTLNHLHAGEQQGRHQHGAIIRDPVNGDHMSGRLEVPAHLRPHGAMTPDHLESHANYVANHVIKHPQGSGMHVSVSHQPGSSHVDYRVQTHPGGTINPHLQPTAAHPHSVNWHVQNAPTVPHPLPGSLNLPNEMPAFRGTIPKHHSTPEHASIQHQEQYSHAIRNNLYANHMQGIGGHDLAVASMQTPDRTGVMYRTPRHLPKSEAANDHLHPYVQHHVAAVAGQDPAKINRMGSHAEINLVSDYLKASGATMQTAPQHLAGRTIGIAGQGGQPCGHGCHQILGRMGVDYAGRNRPMNDETQRAIPLHR